MLFRIYKKYLYIFIILIFQCGCAYFNTFYNAKVYYQEAEKIRLEKDGESIPITAMDKYGKVIEKCQKVLNEFPKSNYKMSAILLMAQARYYRNEYDVAIENLKQINSKDDQKLFEKSKYWISLCKWKKGNSEVAKLELIDLLAKTKSKEIKSISHLSLAEINKELKNSEQVIYHLENAAKYSINRNQKGIIYGRLAEIAFNKKEYKVALSGYRNVISNSISKDKIEDAHLKILKIMRSEKDFKSAEKKIKSLLLDDKFKRIAGELELELVQLYRAQGDFSEIESRLESIVNTYQKTSVSSEAYYELGKIYCSEKWDLKKAKEYFIQVNKESSKSFFVPMANSRVKSIEIYENAQNDLKNHQIIKEKDIEDNSENLETLNVSIQTPKRSIPELLYLLGDLEAFSFTRYDNGINYLEQVIDQYKDSDFHAKSFFTLAFIYDSKGDTINAKIKRDKLLDLYPESDYSKFILNKTDYNEITSKLKNEFIIAKSIIKSDQRKSFKLFKDILKNSPKDILSPFAAFNLAYQYDQIAELDSAIKYYNWIITEYPNSEQNSESEKRVKELNNVLTLINSKEESD
tara:strand:- start:2671 stop:4401 length:1731 start_codon:yes stop_codon:yes gene_type:complete